MVTKVWTGDELVIPNWGHARPDEEITLPAELAAKFEEAGKCKDVKPRRRNSNSEE